MKVNRKKRVSNVDWYKVSKDTVRGWLFILGFLIFALMVAYLYHKWSQFKLKRDTLTFLNEARALAQQIDVETLNRELTRRWNKAWKELDFASLAFNSANFEQAYKAALSSKRLFMSILDEYRGKVAIAWFSNVEGKVEYKRAKGTSYIPARTKVSLYPGDVVRSGPLGSAEIMFRNGTLYKLRPGTEFIIKGAGKEEGSKVELAYGWIDLNSIEASTKVKVPGIVAKVEENSRGAVSYNKTKRESRFATYEGEMELEFEKSGRKERVSDQQMVLVNNEKEVKKMDLPSRVELMVPPNGVLVDLVREKNLVLEWKKLKMVDHYYVQIADNSLFVGTVLEDKNRKKSTAKLALEGEGDFYWRVAAVKDGVMGEWSMPFLFRVIDSSVRFGKEAVDNKPPELKIASIEAHGNIYIIRGITEPGASVMVNNENAVVEADGSFVKTLTLLHPGRQDIVIVAVDSSGNHTVKKIPVVADF